MLVSVIMPTYNQANFLAEAIESVLTQTYTHWELIIVDNFSSDHSSDVIARYQDERIKHVKFANNGVIAASRNYGISQAQGPYLAFLDSDDVWFPTKLSLAVSALDKGADFVSTNIEIFGEKVPATVMRGFDPTDVNRDPFRFILLTDNFVNTSTVVAKRSILKNGFNTNPKIATAEDIDLWLKIFSEEKYRCCYTRAALAKYRIHGGSSSSQVKRHLMAGMEVFEEWNRRGKMTSDQLSRRVGTLYYGMGRKLQLQEKYGESFEYFFQALKRVPWHLKAWAALGLNFFPRKILRKRLL